MQGISFVTIGPFLVSDMSSDENFNTIPVGAHGMEEISLGQKTKAHTHNFPSFYKSKGLDIESEKKVFSLPEQALVLVLPGVVHSWIPKKSGGVVASVDTRHQKQVIELAA